MEFIIAIARAIILLLLQDDYSHNCVSASS